MLYMSKVSRIIYMSFDKIIANAGGEGAVVVNKVREGKGDYGYNARKLQAGG